MLHGYLSKKESFIYQINFFSRFTRVIAVDMTGFGKGNEMEIPYSLSDYVNEIKGILDEIGEEKVDVIAHSFGGRVVAKMLTEENRIDKIIFTGAAGLKPRRGIKYLFKRASFLLLKNFYPKEKLQFLYSNDYRKLSPVMKESLKKIVSENLDECYGKIQNKTLLIFGKKDRETPPSMAKRMRKLVKNSRLTFLLNEGHLCFSENPEKFNGIVFSFMFSE